MFWGFLSADLGYFSINLKTKQNTLLQLYLSGAFIMQSKKVYLRPCWAFMIGRTGEPKAACA